jgi:hypothetical protein
MKRFFRFVAVLCVWLPVLLAACAGRPVRIPGHVVPEDCEVWPGPDRPADRITVALPSTAEPLHAPWARNEGEQLLFRHMYEPLFFIDCRGDVRAGVASTWEKADGGRRWTFQIREDAVFWDGSPVTARDVVESWLDIAVTPVTREAGIDSTVVVGDRLLHVYFNRSIGEVPAVLSQLAFSVTRPPADNVWPVGTGPYEVVGPASGRFGPFGRSIELIPSGRAKGPAISCLGGTTENARDLLDRGTDLTVTADPDVIDYAAGRPELETVPLPWSRTYVLLSTSRAREAKAGRKPRALTDEVSDATARDAVRQDARGCRGPYWWNAGRDCAERHTAVPWLPEVPRGASAASGVRRVLYDSDDPVARDLAGRIVALAATPPDESPEAKAVREALPGLSEPSFGVIADGVTGSNLDASLLEGEDFAYVVALPIRPADACHEVNLLMARAQWLVPLKSNFGRAIVPLVDTRMHAIFNRGRVGLATGFRGVFLLLEKIERGDDPS